MPRRHPRRRRGTPRTERNRARGARHHGYEEPALAGRDLGYTSRMLLLIALGVVFFAGMGALTSLRVLREYERAIVFRLGRARQKALGPGLARILGAGGPD